MTSDLRRDRQSAPLVMVTGLVIRPASGGPAVVDDVGFALGSGEVLGIAGRSGSGKTTTALALLGHLRPGLALRGGSVLVAGIDPFNAGGARRLRGRVVSFLGQDPAAALNPRRRLDMQLGEAVRLRTGLGPAQISAALTELLTAAALPADRAFLRRLPHQISGGQAQRVAFAIAMAGAPDLLVLDEPGGGLDTVLARSVRVLIAELAQRCAVVLVSHDALVIAALTERAMVMETGRVIAVGRQRDVLAKALEPFAPPAGVPSQVGPDKGLRVQALRAGYGGTIAVADVSLAPRRGGCLALVGPSGSGKSTIARCLVGLHRPVAGQMSLDGEPLAATAARRTSAQRRGIQLVGQDNVGALNPRETVRGALLRPLLHLRGLPLTCAEQEVTTLLGRVHLPVSLSDRRPGSLSGGERQRVNLARALAADPEVLVCDESWDSASSS